MAGSKGRFLVVAGVIVVVLWIAVALGLFLLGGKERRAPGYDTFDTMRIIGLRSWGKVKDRGSQAPESWSGMTGTDRLDEWGRVFQVEIDRIPAGDAPESFFEEREPEAPADMMVWLIQVRSMGADGQPETADDILFWRMNSVDDGMAVDQGLVCDEEIWVEFVAQYQYNINSWTGSLGGS